MWRGWLQSGLCVRGRLQSGLCVRGQQSMDQAEAGAGAAAAAAGAVLSGTNYWHAGFTGL